MSLATPASVQKLQTALHAKAKGASSFRFYALYDKVYRKDVLAFAYQCCQANGGAAGVDGQSDPRQLDLPACCLSRECYSSPRAPIIVFFRREIVTVWSFRPVRARRCAQRVPCAISVTSALHDHRHYGIAFAST